MYPFDERIELDGKYLLTYQEHHLTKDICNSSSFYYHTELELSFIKSGYGKYFIEGKHYEARPGDIFILNNIEEHYIYDSRPNEEFVLIVLMFDPRLIWSFESNLFDSRYLDVFFKRTNSFENRLDHNLPVAEDIRQLFMEMEYEFRGKQPEYALMVKVKLLNILVTLIRHYGHISSETGSDERRIKGLSLVNQAISYIDENISNVIRLEDLAKLNYMNPSYFSFYFKKYMGICLSEYIAKKRVNRAIEYLKNSDKSIMDIALSCGFNNTASFNKTFKKVVGKVPSFFRNINMK